MITKDNRAPKAITAWGASPYLDGATVADWNQIGGWNDRKQNEGSINGNGMKEALSGAKAVDSVVFTPVIAAVIALCNFPADSVMD